jgi:hypothetical protein
MAHARKIAAERRDKLRETNMSLRISFERDALARLSAEAGRRDIDRTKLIREIVHEFAYGLPGPGRREGWRS